jgi:hypothetical protein
VPFLDSMYEGPTVRLEPTPPQTRPPRGRLAVVAVLAAVVALSAAAFAAYLGWQALDRADGAHELAAQEGPAPSPAQSPPAASAPPPADATLLLGAPPGATPADWVTRYTGKVLTVRAGCAAQVFLDLDEPRAEVAGPGTDVQSRCAGSGTHLTLGPGAEAAAELPAAGAGSGAAAADAATCDQRLRTEPLADGAAVAVAKGLVLCVRTTPAGTDGPTLVRLEVTALDQNSTTLLASSWRPAR